MKKPYKIRLSNGYACIMMAKDEADAERKVRRDMYNRFANADDDELWIEYVTPATEEDLALLKAAGLTVMES